MEDTFSLESQENSGYRFTEVMKRNDEVNRDSSNSYKVEPKSDFVERYRDGRSPIATYEDGKLLINYEDSATPGLVSEGIKNLSEAMHQSEDLDAKELEAMESASYESSFRGIVEILQRDTSWDVDTATGDDLYTEGMEYDKVSFSGYEESMRSMSGKYRIGL